MIRFSYSNKDTKDEEEKRGVGRRKTTPILGAAPSAKSPTTLYSH
jgi:hypothetical protein